MHRSIRYAIDHKQSEERQKRLARYDSLTGLANRALFRDNVERVLAHRKQHGHFFALLFLDLDRFKDVNDTLGHNVGDALFKQVANRIDGLG